MIKKALDNKLLALIAIAMCSFFCVMILRPTASGHTPHDACTMTQEDRCNNFGFFSNKDTVYEGHELRGLGSITDYVNANDVSSFVNTVRNNLNNAPTFQTSPCLGAGSVPNGWPASGNPNDWPDCYAKKARGIHSAFLIATMLGKSGNDFTTTAINNGDWNALVWARDNVNTWESRVRYYNTKGWVNFDYTQNFNCSTMGEQPSWNITMYGYDMTWIPQCTSQSNATYQTIHFNIPGVTGDTYTIVKSCGNAKGTLNTLNKVYNVESNLVEGPQGSGSNPNMPNASLPTVSYNSENNLIFNYGNGVVEDDRSYIVMTNATGYFATRVFAPLKITRNGVDWNLKGSDVCRTTSDCRSSNSGEYKTLAQMPTQSGGDQNGRKYREIPDNHQTGSDMRVYWYYEAPPSCTLKINGLAGNVNVPSSTSQVSLSWTLTSAARIVFSQPASLANVTKTPTSPQPISVSLSSSSTTFKATPYSTTTGGPAGPDCTVTVAIDSDQPYLKAFGNDVSVGSAFIDTDSSCSTNNAARIDAYVDDSLGKGAGTQFAAHAPSTIKGFLSAVTRQGSAFSPNSPNGLTFGNSQNGTNKITPTINSMGGNSSTTRCIPDYVGMAEANPSKVTKMNTGSISSYLGLPPGTAVMIPQGVKSVTYRDGDLLIDRDIKYASTSWNTLSNIPSLAIIVKGNVYIDKDVTNVDGIIISSGTIYTCTSSAALNRTTMPTYPTCNNKLTVNGTFIANSVKFWRTNGDVSAATPNEGDIPNIAEVFNFSPEIYVGQMPELFKRTTAKKNYDYITSLPPTL